MDIRKAIVSAVVLYAVIFLVASVLMGSVNGTMLGLITVLTAIALTFLIANKYYFKGMKIKNPVREGLMLGLVLVVVSIAIEISVMFFGFAANQGWDWFMTWHVMLGYLLMLVVPVFAAYKKK